MKKMVLVFALMVLISGSACAQNFVHSYDATNIQSVVQAAATADGNAVLLCQVFDQTTGAPGSALLKCSPAGEVLWSKKISGIPHLLFSSMLIDPSGNILCCGSAFNPSDRSMKLALLSVAPDGSLQAKQLLFPYPQQFPQSTAITRLADGRIAMSMDGTGGTMMTQVVIFNSDLSISKGFAFNYGLYGKILLKMENDTTLAIHGTTISGSPIELRLLCSLNGTPMGVRSYEANSGPLSLTDFSQEGLELTAMLHHSNGTTYATGGLPVLLPKSVRPALLRMDAKGNILFAKGFRDVEKMRGTALQELPDHTILLTLATAEATPAKLGAVAHLDTNGTLIDFFELTDPKKQTVPYSNGVVSFGDGRMLLWEDRSIANNLPHAGTLMLIGMSDIPTHCMSTENLCSVGDLASVQKEVAVSVVGYPISLTTFDTALTLVDQSMGSFADLCTASDVAIAAAPASSIALYPNPVAKQQQITITVQGIPNGSYIITLRDAAARTIERYQIEYHNEEALHLPSAKLASGMYFLELSDPDSFAAIRRTKIVVK